MLPLVENHKICPRCGNPNAALIMDVFGTMLELDSWGYPQYHRPDGANTFTILDLPANTNSREKEGDHGNQSH